MKALLTVACLFILTTFCVAQAPQAFNYSAVVRNGTGTPIPNQLVKFRLSILRTTVTGTNVYTETHSTTTDGNGMVNLEIGRGTVISGVFAAIPWNNDAFFLQVEVDPTGGNTFLLMGTTQFLSVPYALNAKYSENVAAQLGLYVSSDTLHIFRGESSTDRLGPYNASIRYFGGNQENFTYSVSNIPAGVTFNVPTNTAYNFNTAFNNTPEIILPQSLSVSNVAVPGRYPLTYKITTATNRVVQKDFILHILDDCELVNYMMGKRFTFEMYPTACQYIYRHVEDVIIVPNISNPTCGIALQFANGNKLNLIVNKGNLSINSTQNVGNFISTYGSPTVYNYQNVTFNSGNIINDAWYPTTSLPLYQFTTILNSSVSVSNNDPNANSCVGILTAGIEVYLTYNP